MISNENDDRHEGNEQIMQGRDLYTRSLEDWQSDYMLDQMVYNNDLHEGVLILHPVEDPLRRAWSLNVGTLSVSRLRADRKQGSDVVFYGSDVAHGIYTFMQGHGEDPLLKVMADGVIWEPGDVFTIHYDSDRKLQPWWTLETADNLLFKKPASYPEKP